MGWLDWIGNVVNAAVTVASKLVPTVTRAVKQVRQTWTNIVSAPTPSARAENVVTAAQAVTQAAATTTRAVVRDVSRAATQGIAAAREHDEQLRAAAGRAAGMVAAEAARRMATAATQVQAALTTTRTATQAAETAQAVYDRQQAALDEDNRLRMELAAPDIPLTDEAALEGRLVDWARNPDLQLPADPRFDTVAKAIWDSGWSQQEKVRMVNAAHKFIYKRSLYAGEPGGMTREDVILLARGILEVP